MGARKQSGWVRCLNGLLALLLALPLVGYQTRAVQAAENCPPGMEPALCQAAGAKQAGALAGKNQSQQPAEQAGSAISASSQFALAEDSKLPAAEQAGADSAGPLAVEVKNSVGPAGSRISTCAAQPVGGWTTTSLSQVVVIECSLDFPEAGQVLIQASSSLAIATGSSDYEGRFILQVDGSLYLPSRQWVNIYTDGLDGSDKNLDLSSLQPVTAGVHTFALTGALASGAGIVQLFAPTLSVMFIPASSPIQTCSGGNAIYNWINDTTTDNTVVECAINAASEGYAFIKASQSAALLSGAVTWYDAEIHVEQNGSTLYNSIRRINVYPDSGDGSDESLATSTIAPVLSGANTFTLRARRYEGGSTVLLFNPNISVLFFPKSFVAVKVCGDGAAQWENVTTTYSEMVSCSLTMGAGTALVVSTASLGMSPGSVAYEGEFRFLVNGSVITPSRRWVNIYDDSGDGNDRMLSSIELIPLAAGTHTFSMNGRRYGGSGILRANYPTIMVLAPAYSLMLPIVIK